MAFSFRRRGTVLAITATTAVVGSYFATVAGAAGLTGTAITTNPAANSSGVVQANRPSFIATYSANISSASTITVTQGSTTINCPATVSGSQISCTPTADLVNNDAYAVTSHGVSAADGSTADLGPTNFTDAHPTLASSIPTPQGSVVIPSNKPPALKATFANADSSEGISTTKSTFTVYELSNGQRANPIQGSVTFTSSNGNPVTGGTTDTINFSASMAPGEYEAAIHVDAADSSDVDNPASFDDEDFTFWVTNAAPKGLSAPQIANNQNDKAFPFSGTAAPGLTVTVNVTDSGTPVANTTSGSTLVTPCSTAPDCPWTVKVDLTTGSTNPQPLAEGPLTWTAQGKDAVPNNTPTADGPQVTKDTSAPTVTGVTASPPSANADTANVTATSSDTDVASYQVTMTDQDSNKIGPFNFAAVNNNLPSTSISLDGLDDGKITTVVTATDKAGNVSPGKSPANTFDKSVGLKPDLGLSKVTTPAGDVTFTNVSAHAVQSPSQVVLHFTEPVQPSWQDNSSAANAGGTGPTHTSSFCFKDSHGNCVNGGVTFSSDDRSMMASFTGKLAAGNYTISATAWPKNFCPTVTFPDMVSSSCTDGAFNGTVNKADGTPLVFVVDSTAPAGPTVTVVPSPTIDGAIDSNGKPHAADVTFAGTAEPGSSVLVKVKSSGASTLLIANPSGNPATTDSNGNWSLSGVNLTSLVDGTLTVTVTATDAAGNVSPPGGPTPAPTLAARPSAPQNFKATVDSTSATLSWGAPVSSGGQAINGYTLTYTDTTAGTPTQTANPTTTPYTVNGLVTGDTYKFTLCATNGVGGPCNNATLTVIPRNASVLTALISHSTVTYGTRITLSGRLTSKSSGLGLPAEPVTITTTYDNRSHGTTLHTTTSSAGGWSVSFTPAHDAVYTVAFAGDKTNAPATASVRSFVRERLTIGVKSRSSSHRTAVTISGSAGPSQAGRLVYIYEHTSRGNKLVGRARLSSRSTYALSHLFARGTHTVFAEFFAQNGNATGVSHSVRFTRS